jgi:hypothetical protein
MGMSGELRPAAAPTAPAPSMEEIMASVRRIITEDRPGGPDEPPVLELTEIVRELPPTTAGPAVSGGLALAAGREAGTPRRAPGEPDLVAPAVAEAAGAAFARLVRTATPETPPPPVPGSLEAVVQDLLRPQIKAWLDQNLPALVERIVEREVEKLIRRAERS